MKAWFRHASPGSELGGEESSSLEVVDVGVRGTPGSWEGTSDSSDPCCNPGGLEVACNKVINPFVLILCFRNK